MSSNNYAVFGENFSLEGAFRVLRMETFPSANLDYDEVAECGVSTHSGELRELIAKANSLRFADFGNGLRGVYAQCAEFHFCVVPEVTQETITEPKPKCHSEHSDEEIF